MAGPVAVGAVLIPSSFNKKFFKGIKDSKQLSESERELWFSLAKEAKKKGELNYHVSLVSEKVIDKHGISYAIRLGIKRCIKSLEVDRSSQVFLDGSLKAPEEFKHQLTVVKGDEKIPVISLASICAKVTRDRKMVKISQDYPEFGFEIHKGYGTRKHLSALKKHGLTPIHRRSFVH